MLNKIKKLIQKLIEKKTIQEKTITTSDTNEFCENKEDSREPIPIPSQE